MPGLKTETVENRLLTTRPDERSREIVHKALLTDKIDYFRTKSPPEKPTLVSSETGLGWG